MELNGSCSVSLQNIYFTVPDVSTNGTCDPNSSGLCPFNTNLSDMWSFPWSHFVLAKNQLEPSQVNHATRDGRVETSILLAWLWAMAVLSEAYKGVILSFMTKPSAAVWPAGLQELIGDKSFFLMSFDTEGQLNPSGHVTSVPLLEAKNKIILSQFFGKEYWKMQQSNTPSGMPTERQPNSFAQVNRYGCGEGTALF